MPSVRIVHGRFLADDTALAGIAFSKPPQPIAHQRRRELRHRDAAGFGSMVERCDEIAVEPRRVVAGAWHERRPPWFEFTVPKMALEYAPVKGAAPTSARGRIVNESYLVQRRAFPASIGQETRVCADECSPRR